MRERKRKRPAGRGGGAAPARDLPDQAKASLTVHKHIGAQLKAVFHSVLEEPVPDKFHQLLEELERKERERS